MLLKPLPPLLVSTLDAMTMNGHVSHISFMLYIYRLLSKMLNIIVIYWLIGPRRWMDMSEVHWWCWSQQCRCGEGGCIVFCACVLWWLSVLECQHNRTDVSFKQWGVWLRWSPHHMHTVNYSHWLCKPSLLSTPPPKLSSDSVLLPFKSWGPSRWNGGDLWWHLQLQQSTSNKGNKLRMWRTWWIGFIHILPHRYPYPLDSIIVTQLVKSWSTAHTYICFEELWDHSQYNTIAFRLLPALSYPALKSCEDEDARLPKVLKQDDLLLEAAALRDELEQGMFTSPYHTLQSYTMEK